MKSLFKIFLGALALVTSGCSSDEAPSTANEVSSEVIEGLQLSGSVATYTKISHTFFHRESLSDTQWKEFNIEDWDGSVTYLESIFIFQDGKIWTEAQYFSTSSGPAPLLLLWAAYCEAADESRDLYVGHEFTYDDELKQIIVKEMKTNGLTYDMNLEVTSFTDENMELSFVNYFEDGYPVKGGLQKETAKYRRTSTDRMDESKILAFDSQYDCDMYVWQKAYDTFGRYVNVNDVFGPEVKFDSPVIDIERWKPQSKN